MDDSVEISATHCRPHEQSLGSRSLPGSLLSASEPDSRFSSSAGMFDVVGGVIGGVGSIRLIGAECDCVFARRARFWRGGAFVGAATTTLLAAANASSRETTGEPSLAKLPSDAMFVFCVRIGGITAEVVETSKGKTETEKSITKERCSDDLDFIAHTCKWVSAVSHIGALLFPTAETQPSCTNLPIPPYQLRLVGLVHTNRFKLCGRHMANALS